MTQGRRVRDHVREGQLTAAQARAAVQGRLDFQRLARREHPETSRQAAKEIAPTLSILRTEALRLVKAHPGSTASELAEYDGHRDTRRIPRRLPGLERQGLIKRGPARACRVTGRQATTWEVEA